MKGKDLLKYLQELDEDQLEYKVIISTNLCKDEEGIWREVEPISMLNLDNQHGYINVTAFDPVKKMLNIEEKKRPEAQEQKYIHPEERYKGWPFEVDRENHPYEDIVKLLEVPQTKFVDIIKGGMSKLAMDSKLTEAERGGFTRGIYIEHDLDTALGPKDIIFFLYLESLGKKNEEAEHASCQAFVAKVQFAEPGEVTDEFIDFMTETGAKFNNAKEKKA